VKKKFDHTDHSCNVAASGFVVVKQEKEVCGVVGGLEKSERERGTGAAWSRVASTDAVHEAVEIPRS